MTRLNEWVLRPWPSRSSFEMALLIPISYIYWTLWHITNIHNTSHVFLSHTHTYCRSSVRIRCVRVGFSIVVFITQNARDQNQPWVSENLFSNFLKSSAVPFRTFKPITVKQSTVSSTLRTVIAILFTFYTFTWKPLNNSRAFESDSQAWHNMNEHCVKWTV